MDIRKVKKLIELLEESGIAEIEIKEGEESVRISRTRRRPFHTHAGADGLRTAAGTVAAPARRLPPRELAAARQRRTARPDSAVPAPMVGTFYAAAAPGAKPFVAARRRGQGRPRAVHHRGHEDDEPDRMRQGRPRHRHPGQERRPGRVRPALFVIE